MFEGVQGLVPKLLEFRHRRQWEQFHRPKELATALSIEAGELLELFLWRDMEHAEDVKADQKRMECISDEVADVLIYLTFLSHDLGIDLEEAVKKKMVKNAAKYPEEQYRGRFRKPED